MVLKNILEAVGNTPLVELSRMEGDCSARILAKVECLNVGGSIKTRTALGMIEAAERDGKIGPGSVIVEPTSGNQGVSLALIAVVKGYRAKIVMPASMSRERQQLIRSYGAELILTPEGKDILETFQICIEKAYALRAEDPNVFIPQQFENPANPDIHRKTTAREIIEEIDGPLDAFVAGIGTGGSITGIGEVLKETFPGIIIIGVEPQNAAVLSGGRISSHSQQGIGDGFVPPVLNRNIIDEVLCVPDEAAIATARELAAKEGILAGISSGSNVWASQQVARKIGTGKTIATLLPDTGERYLSMDVFGT